MKIILFVKLLIKIRQTVYEKLLGYDKFNDARKRK